MLIHLLNARFLGWALAVEDYLEFIMPPSRMKMDVQLLRKYLKRVLPSLIHQIFMERIMIMKSWLVR